MLKCNCSSHELSTPVADNIYVKSYMQKIPLLMLRITMTLG